MKSKTFYNYAKVLSFDWAWIIAVIGARGRGKTYGAKKWLLNGWLYKKEQFIILRDSEDECKTIAKDNGLRFWEDVISDSKYRGKKIDIEMTKDSVTINGELAGFVMPASLFYKFKGSQYNKVKRLLYDEFIRENQVRFNGNRALQFLNSVFTIGRFRNDFKLVMTANALDRGDTLLVDLFAVQIRDFGIYKRREKGVVVDYTPNSKEFVELQKNSQAYKLVKGTRFEANLIGNKFVDDGDNAYFDKRKPCDLYGIYYNARENAFVRIYLAKDGSEWYACRDVNPNTVAYMRFTFDLGAVTTRIRLAPIEEKKILQNIFAKSLLKFENSYIMKVFKEIIK